MSTNQPYRVTVTNADGTKTWGHDTPASAEGHYLMAVEQGKSGDTITIEMLKADGKTYVQPAWNLETSVTL
jgi:hypothetical protein